jgi:hypothetical protein
VLQIWTNRSINNHPVTIIELISAGARTHANNRLVSA